MTTRQYRKLKGMELGFVSGMVEENPSERAIGCSITLRMALDFTHFVQMANVYIPQYLNVPTNAIRPELDGLAYRYSYNYFSEAAGNIDNNEALFDIFTHSSNYMDQWSSGGLEKRYGKPSFEVLDGQLQVTARTDFRWEGDKRQIVIGDLPIVRFQWALSFLEWHSAFYRAAQTKVVVGYAQEEHVEVEGLQMRRGTRYIIGKKLEFGDIRKEQILTAG